MTCAFLTALGLQGLVATVRAAMSLASSLGTSFPGSEQNHLLQGRDVTFAKLTHHDLLHQQASWQIPAVLLWQNLSRIKEKIKLEVGNKCFSVLMPSSSWFHRGISNEIWGKPVRSQPKPTDFNPLSEFCSFCCLLELVLECILGFQACLLLANSAHLLKIKLSYSDTAHLATDCFMFTVYWFLLTGTIEKKHFSFKVVPEDNGRLQSLTLYKSFILIDSIFTYYECIF